MNRYADTAFLVSLHSPDAHTEKVIAWFEEHREPLPFTGLHRLEFRNALRLRVFRREITVRQREQGIQAMLGDIAANVFYGIDPPWPDVLLEADRLSSSHSESLGTRSLDILHVASALVLGSSEFLTFDRRQAAMAQAVGLYCPNL